MIDSSWSQRVADVMKSLGREFSENELAYLAIPSKIEHQIRDRLAYSLHQNFTDSRGIFIAREWPNRRTKIRKWLKRVDLTIIDDSKPRLFLEAKAMYAFNFWTNYRFTVLRNIQKELTDLENNYPGGNVEKLALVLATDCDGAPDRSLDDIFKYGPSLRRYHKNRRSESEIHGAAKDLFSEFETFSKGKIPGGNAFGMNANVYYWLFRPISTGT